MTKVVALEIDEEAVEKKTETESTTEVGKGPPTTTPFRLRNKTIHLTYWQLLFAKCGAEFIAMTLFVFIGCGAAISGLRQRPDVVLAGWVLGTSLSFGMAITTLAYSIGHVSGGHINSAVTIGLMITGDCGIIEGLMIILFQVFGAVFGAGLLAILYNKSNDPTGALASNAVANNVGLGSAFFGEFFMTFLLFFVVAECALRNRLDYKPNLQLGGIGFNAPIAIGLAVFLAHMVLISVDGCSINPTRSLGPLIVATGRGLPDNSKHWEHFPIFLFGPTLGAAVAAVLHRCTRT